MGIKTGIFVFLGMQHISGISYYQILISSLEEHFKKLGYQSMLEIYMKRNPSLCEPPYKRPIRMVCVRCSRLVYSKAVYSIGSSLYYLEFVHTIV
jgi:hypothetical protein